MTSKTTSRSRKRPVEPTAGGAAPPTGSPRDHYHREKARRAKRTAESDAMAAARREYLALLEADAAKGKGGRPRKKPAAPAQDTPESNDESEDATEE